MGTSFSRGSAAVFIVGEARDGFPVVLPALPPEAATLPAAESTRAVRNRETLAHGILDNGDQLPDVFAVAHQNRKRLRYGFRDRFDSRLAASDEIGVRAELDPLRVLPFFHEEF